MRNSTVYGTLSTQRTAGNCDASHRICDGPSPGDSAEDDIEIGNVCTDDVNSSNLQLLNAAIAAVVTGVRGRARGDTPTTVKVPLRRHLAINYYAVEQQLFKAYVRSQRFERLGARDATHVRIQYELGGRSAVLLRMLPGREVVAVDVDAVVALMGVVYCGQDGFLVRRDSYFHDSR